MHLKPGSHYTPFEWSGRCAVHTTGLVVQYQIFQKQTSYINVLNSRYKPSKHVLAVIPVSDSTQ